MAEGNIIVKICKQNEITKTFNESIKLNANNWVDYSKTLKTVQMNVNLYLTELVEMEQNQDIIGGSGESNVEDDSEDEDNENLCKRKLSITEPNRQKKSKT